MCDVKFSIVVSTRNAMHKLDNIVSIAIQPLS